MKTLINITIALILLTSSLQTLAYADVSTFQRLLIVNQANELMVVKIKGKDFWVTPGFYQTKDQMLKAAITTQAKSYGLSLSEPELRGSFTLINRDRDTVSSRNFYLLKAKTKENKMPEYIEEVLWLPIGQATKIMTFPHINFLTQAIFDQPDTVLGGSVERYSSEGKQKITILEETYPLFK